ncbi:MAG: signal recognition particle protein [Candidatus Aureabacteria bacterium]|nr:signal recognition particle protein [Candidatus Auribacterota bacterium]
MFDELTLKFGRLFKNLRGYGRLSEKNIEDALRDVRLALLEADVNYHVVREFIESVKQKALGEKVLSSISPGQQFIKVLFDELAKFLSGGENEEVLPEDRIILMAGLQGSGKTTTCGKLGRMLKNKNRKTLLAACDIHRPAAVEQLIQLGRINGLDVYSGKKQGNAVDIARDSLSVFREGKYDHLIIDSAGRMHIDDAMMDEIVEIKKEVIPSKIYFVADSCTGQDAVLSAESFHKALDFSGVILTKLDGDTRGGAAISIRHVTGKPVVYAGTGEKSGDLEIFYPERMASRILGMGDVVTLVEKARDSLDREEAENLLKKIKKQEFNFNDFLKQVKQLKKMGSLTDLLGYLPGAGKLKGLNVDDSELTRIEAIVSSMTAKERNNPSVINGSRRKRIAAGSGTTLQDVNSLMKRFEMSGKMLKKLTQFKGKMPDIPGFGL